MKFLVTGAAGFIGSKVSYRLLEEGHEVVGVDNLNDYYDPNLKYARLKHFFNINNPDWSTFFSVPKTGGSREKLEHPNMPWNQVIKSPVFKNFKFLRIDITNSEDIKKLFEKEHFDKVINLAAQAGVRYSIENPVAYVETNVMGFTNVLECCRDFYVKHLIYASSSSVYGGSLKTPFEENDLADNPVSLYAATKRSNELFASVYSRIYGLNTTGLRFFTVYGPWGRPDMAPMLFSNAIMRDEPINVFNNGNLSRDFTYIDDIVEGVLKIANAHLTDTVSINEVYNIGHGKPVNLMDFIHLIEDSIGKVGKKNMLPMQKGDVNTTYADTTKLYQKYGYKPSTSFPDGIRMFIDWYKSYYSK